MDIYRVTIARAFRPFRTVYNGVWSFKVENGYAEIDDSKHGKIFHSLQEGEKIQISCSKKTKAQDDIIQEFFSSRPFT